MLFLLVAGLACIFAPTYIMAMAGLDAHLEDEGCIVWFFRIFGLILVGIYAYFAFFR